MRADAPSGSWSRVKPKSAFTGSDLPLPKEHARARHTKRAGGATLKLVQMRHKEKKRKKRTRSPSAQISQSHLVISYKQMRVARHQAMSSSSQGFARRHLHNPVHKRNEALPLREKKSEERDFVIRKCV
ncbi:hypothetical protein BHE74_00040452 [Ensete ventricosum]|nr:hypothetical protein BHE74_00040452 [Ensete ventricosum]